MINVRSLVISIVLLIGVMFFINYYAEVGEVVDTLQRGDWRILLLALVFMGLWVINVGATYKAVYRALGIDESLWELSLLSSAAQFVNIVTMSGLLGGIALYVTQARRKGYSSVRAALAGVLFVLFDYIGFIFVLVIGLYVLLRRGQINPPEIVASVILFIIAGVLTFLVNLGMHSGEALGNALAWMANTGNKFLALFGKSNHFSADRGREFAFDAASGLQELRKKPGSLMWPIALAFSSKAILVVVFFLMFLAFKVPYTPGTLVAGFSIAYLFMIVTPTPAGIGVAEGILTLSLRGLYVPLGSAAVIALAFRGFSVWLPLLWGMIALRVVDRIAGTEEEDE